MQATSSVTWPLKWGRYYYKAYLWGIEIQVLLALAARLCGFARSVEGST